MQSRGRCVWCMFTGADRPWKLGNGPIPSPPTKEPPSPLLQQYNTPSSSEQPITPLPQPSQSSRPQSSSDRSVPATNVEADTKLRSHYAPPQVVFYFATLYRKHRSAGSLISYIPVSSVVGGQGPNHSVDAVPVLTRRCDLPPLLQPGKWISICEPNEAAALLFSASDE